MASCTPPNRNPLDEDESADAMLPSAGRRRRASVSKVNPTLGDSTKVVEDEKASGLTMNALPTAPKSPRGSVISSAHRSQSTGVEAAQPLFSGSHHASSSLGLGATSYQSRPKAATSNSSDFREIATSGLSSSNSSLSSASSARTGSYSSGISGVSGISSQRDEQTANQSGKFQSSSTSSLRSAATTDTSRSTGSFPSRSDSGQSRDSVPRRSSKPNTNSRGASTSASSIGSIASLSSAGSGTSAVTLGSVSSAPTSTSGSGSNFVSRAGEWRPITNIPVINFLQIKGRTVREWSGHRDGGSGVAGLIKPFAISFCTGSRDLLSKIANEADHEYWGEGNSDLHYYLERTWHRATDLSRDHSTIVGFYPNLTSASGNVSETVIQSGSPLMIMFHTGLLSKSGNGFLFGVLVPYRPSKAQKSPPMWLFTEVYTIEVLFNPRMMEAKQLYGIGKHQLPKKVWYWSSHVSDLYYDPSIPIEDAFDANHLFGDPDSDRRSRIPPKYRTHTKEELLGRLRESVRRMKLYAMAAPRAVIPQFFWDKNEQSRATTGHLQMLLPIALDYSRPKEIDCCAVLRRDSHTAYDPHHTSLSSSLPVLPTYASNLLPVTSGASFDLSSSQIPSSSTTVSSPMPDVYFYRIISIYSLSMAYANARLIQPVDAPWLLQGYLKMTGQGSLLNTSVGSLNSNKSDYIAEQSMQLSSGWLSTGFASSNSTGTDSSDMRSDSSSHADSIISSSEASEDSIDSVASISAPNFEIFASSSDTLDSRTASTSAPSLAVPHIPGAPHGHLANARFTPQLGRKNAGKVSPGQRAQPPAQPLPVIPESPAIARRTDLTSSAPVSSPKSTAIRIPPNFSPQAQAAASSSPATSSPRTIASASDVEKIPPAQGIQKTSPERGIDLLDSIKYSTIAMGTERHHHSGKTPNSAKPDSSVLQKANSSPDISRRSSASSSASSSPKSASPAHSMGSSAGVPLEKSGKGQRASKSDGAGSFQFLHGSSSSSSSSSVHSEGDLTNWKRLSGSAIPSDLQSDYRFTLPSHSVESSSLDSRTPHGHALHGDGNGVAHGDLSQKLESQIVSFPITSSSASPATLNAVASSNASGAMMPMYIMTPAMLANLASGKMVANMENFGSGISGVGAPTLTIQAVKPKVMRQSSEIRDYRATGYVVLLRVIRHWISLNPGLDPVLCELGQIAPHIQRFLPELKGPGRCLAYVNQACTAGLVEMRNQGKQHFVTMTPEGEAVDTSSLHPGKRQAQKRQQEPHNQTMDPTKAQTNFSQNSSSPAAPSQQDLLTVQPPPTSTSYLSPSPIRHRLAIPHLQTNEEIISSSLSSPSSTETLSPHSSSTPPSPHLNQETVPEKQEKGRQKSKNSKLKRSADGKSAPKRSGKINRHKKSSSLDPATDKIKSPSRTPDGDVSSSSSPHESTKASPDGSPTPSVRKPPARRFSEASGPSPIMNTSGIVAQKNAASQLDSTDA